MMLEKLLLVCLIVFAILSISTVNFRRAVIYLAAFSLIMSLSFLFYKAPDVAIAEAVIGSAMATVLYLVALRKQDRLTVCLLGAACSQPDAAEGANGLSADAASLLQAIRVHFQLKRITVHVIRSDEPLETLLEMQFHDLLLCQADNRLTLYGRPADYRLDEIERLVASGDLSQTGIRIVRCEKGGTCDA